MVFRLFLFVFEESLSLTVANGGEDTMCEICKSDVRVGKVGKDRDETRLARSCYC